MTEFRYRTATDAELWEKHFACLNEDRTFAADLAGSRIVFGLDDDETNDLVANGLTFEYLARIAARIDIVRIKLCKEPSLCDVLREYGDETRLTEEHQE
ncbi:hypothetical protein ACIOD2_27155 [Amycolatopsis sp. NPDC088138]|uniref:hypothetical protein n=1 Tax=Amycolatopsis sp. NPDC088138 TaxID=3363938 RepID=UPI0038077F0F